MLKPQHGGLSQGDRLNGTARLLHWAGPPCANNQDFRNVLVALTFFGAGEATNCFTEQAEQYRKPRRLTIDGKRLVKALNQSRKGVLMPQTQGDAVTSW